MIVIDASALVEWLLRTSVGFRVAHRVVTSGNSLHAPELTFVEVTHAFRRMLTNGILTLNRAEEALQDLAMLRLKSHPHLSLLGRMWDLRNSVSAYDATYVALAERLNATLLTCDKRLGGAHGHRAHIEVL